MRSLQKSNDSRERRKDENEEENENNTQIFGTFGKKQQKANRGGKVRNFLNDAAFTVNIEQLLSHKINRL